MKTIIGLTETAKKNFQNWLDEHAGKGYGFDASEEFNTIEYFQPDKTATYELAPSKTKARNPEIFDFTADDFLYIEEK